MKLKGGIEMIKASEDKALDSRIDLVFDNLFDIFKIQSRDNNNFRTALKRELYIELDDHGYHKNCRIE